MTLSELDTYFNSLRDLTDRVALMNSPYDSDLEGAFKEMEEFMDDAMSWELEEMEEALLKGYLSHMSFHREIIAETIVEARELLIPERRSYLKRLVNYHKNFVNWFDTIEKEYAA